MRKHLQLRLEESLQLCNALSNRDHSSPCIHIILIMTRHRLHQRPQVHINHGLANLKTERHKNTAEDLWSPQNSYGQVEIKSSLENSKVLLCGQEVVHPVRLEPDQHHVGRELAQSGKVQAGLCPLLKAVTLSH